MKERLREWRFLQLALCLAALFIVVPWASEHWMFQIAVQLFLLNSLLVTISEEGRKSRLRPFLWITWGLSVVASILTCAASSFRLPRRRVCVLRRDC